MPKSNTAVVTIGIDPRKNTLHLLMQAARVVLLRPRNWMKHGFGPWLAAATQRLHHNVLATALANMLARIAWSVLAQHRVYDARLSAAAV
jgi:transposase